MVWSTACEASNPSQYGRICAAMKSTAEASSGWSIQTVQISPVDTGTGLERFTLWMSLMRSSTLISARSVVSLPTMMALFLGDPGSDGDFQAEFRGDGRHQLGAAGSRIGTDRPRIGSDRL